MIITVSNFLSIKNAQLDIEKGITVIAGKNGCGKSQFLLGIAQKGTENNLLREFGFVRNKYDINEHIDISPMPPLILFRPAIRNIAENNKGNEFAYTRPLVDYINPKERKGYITNTQDKFKNLYSILANYYNAGTNVNADPEIKKRWDILCENFYNVFNKKLIGEINIFNGTKIGLQLEDGSISSINTLSTGELEFLSLLSDLVFEYLFDESDGIETKTLNKSKIKGYNKEIFKASMVLIDELDAHFHPDLQMKIIKTIKPLCKDKYLIITTHSPSVMLSANNEHLYYMQDSISSKGKNQLIKVSNDIDMYTYLSEMYKGFVGDVKLSNHILNANNNVILKYAKECLSDSNAVKGNTTRECDPQVSSIRTAVLYKVPKTIVEIGAGRGRLFTAFSGFDENFLKESKYYAIEPNLDYHDNIKEMAENSKIHDKMKKLYILKQLSKNVKYDLCIMSNLLHEIPPTKMSNFLNKYIQQANPNSIITILEVSELAVGEKGFTMFYPEAIREIFINYTNNCFFNHTEHKSFKGTILYDMNLKIIDPKFNIKNEDIIKGLEKVKNIECRAIKENQENNNLSPLTFAFKSHNLAYAEMYLQQLQGLI
jgi:AAA15 family ATPase/GTPase